MQIHELTQLNEQGILQGIKSAAQGVKGAVQGYQQSKQDRTTQQGIKNVSDRAVKAWDQYAKQLKAANPDPTRYAQLYKQALMAFVQKNMLKGQPIANAINRQEITQLIDAMTAQADNPTAVTNLFSKLVQQAVTSSTDVSTGAGQLMVKVVNPDPAVLQFRNKTYIINDQGEWADQVTGSVADQSFQAFLDQELAKAVPNAQAQLTPQATAGTATNNLNAVLQQLGIDQAKIAQLQKTVQADPAAAAQLKKTLGL
jgi:uncharacterized membrane-anchored protein YjiN (DUF445 family)